LDPATGGVGAIERPTVRLNFIDPCPTGAILGRASAPFGPQLQPATTREAGFVVCDLSIHYWFRRWCIDGTWERLNAEQRGRLRCRLGRHPNPGAGVVDPRSVKTTGIGGSERGFDFAKKIEGRKRHLLVDTEGLMLEARVHGARVPDADGIRRC
jgi:transposase